MARNFPPSGSPFHSGELDAQRRMGAAEKIAPFAARAIRSFLPEQHREFFSELPFLVLCARTTAGHPALTSLTGSPGFAHSPTPNTLRVEALPLPGDPLGGSLEVGADVGILGLQPHTRRRNRENGVVFSTHPGGFEVWVEQSYGNCKQHITPRLLEPAERSPSAPQISYELEGVARHLVEKSDTFFIGTGADGDGVDASHRGGPPGFVRIESARTLVFPDYGGNNFYNTMGNLLRDARVALLFIDFSAGDLLHVFGTATIDWCDRDERHAHPPVERRVRVDIEQLVLRRAAWALTTSFETDGGQATERD